MEVREEADVALVPDVTGLVDDGGGRCDSAAASADD
jgi:hypothetical protein